MINNQMAVFIDFENIALWADQEFFDFEMTTLMAYLQTRGPAVVKRAYGDWSRFSRYRDELMNNSIDLIQIYSVRQGKNRADIRMAIDALEISMTRPQINTYVIVSGDSDFSPLVAKLREYGRYTLGIGPRNISHPLLVKSCDEFVYLETALGETTEADAQTNVDRELARELLVKALQAHGQRGDIPVLATRLKQTMLLMDPAFNEANFGYSQFKSWLEDNRDRVKLFIKDLQLFVAPIDYNLATDMEPAPGENISIPVDTPLSTPPTLESQYRQLFNRLKLPTGDLAPRRDILRDIYRELTDHPGERNTEELIETLYERYETLGLNRNKSTIRDIVQMAIHQHAVDYQRQPASPYTPLSLEPTIDGEAGFVYRAEAEFVYSVIRSGLEVDPAELACIILNDRNQGDYIQLLLDDLAARNQIIHRGKRFVVSGPGSVPFCDEASLQVLCRDIGQVDVPPNLQINAETANSLAKKAMVQRSQDFAASANTYLMACRIQWDAVENGLAGATVEDLRWYMASYASAIAGKLSQVNHDYTGARPYYLAFFALVQEDDTLWGQMRGLINPMLAYYWANAARELDLNVSAWNLSMSSPAQIAINAATHPNSDLRKLWHKITVELAQVNPGLLRRIANQIMTTRSDLPENARVAEQIQEILTNLTPA